MSDEERDCPICGDKQIKLPDDEISSVRDDGWYHVLLSKECVVTTREIR